MSADEIFSLLFLLLTLYFMLKHVLISKKSRHLGISVLCYIMALLSKENGLAFVILIPLTLYFITKEKFIVILKLSAPYVMVAVTYIAVRILMIGINNNEVTEVMDNPYVLASLSEKYATLLLVFLKYIQLLIFPHPLTYDYSFNQTPYRNFSDMWVLFSLFLHLLMVIFVVLNFKKKDILAWCILLYAGSIFLVSNIAFNIGAPMAERFLFQPSVAFVIFLVELWRRFVARGLLNYQGFSSLTFIILIPAIIISCYAAIKRNQVWQSDEVLFLTDVKTSYGSARANTYAGVALIRLCDRSKNPQLKQDYALDALDYFRRSLQIKSDYITTLLNMGVAYSRLDSVEEAEAVWNHARAVNPNDKNFIVYDRYLAESFYKQGLKAGVNKDFQVAIINLENSLEYEPVNVEGWYNLGGAYYSIKQYTEAKSCWEKTLQLNPKHEQAALGLEALLEIGY
jgi:tetratricopeptide (TPR) repeat protein